MSDLELEEFSLTYFPKDKRVVVFSYGNIYQQETNFKLALILATSSLGLNGFVT